MEYTNDTPERKPVFGIRAFGGRVYLFANQNFCELLALALRKRRQGTAPFEKSLNALAEQLGDIQDESVCKGKTDEAPDFQVQTVFHRYAVAELIPDLARRIMRVMEDRKEEANMFEPPLFNLLTQTEELLFAMRQGGEVKITGPHFEMRPFYGRLYILGNREFCQAMSTFLRERRETDNFLEPQVTALAERLHPGSPVKKRKRTADGFGRPTFEVKHFIASTCICMSPELGRRILRVVEDRKFERDDVPQAFVNWLEQSEDQLHALRKFREQRQSRWYEEQEGQ